MKEIKKIGGSCDCFPLDRHGNISSRYLISKITTLEETVDKLIDLLSKERKRKGFFSWIKK